MHTCIYMKCLQQTPVRTSLLSTNFGLLWVKICFNNPQIGNKITIKLRFRMVFQNKMQTLMRWYRTVRVRYVFCTMPNGGPARALLARNIQLAYALFCLHYIYILFTYVLLLMINSTMYTIVPVCVLFSNFGKINAVYMYFYPDYYSKFDLKKVLKLLSALT